jgi:excisionase family DNA binding protein
VGEAVQHGALIKAWPDAANALCIKRSKLWELIMSGELESVKIGCNRLVPTRAIDDYINRLREEEARNRRAGAA